MMHFIIFMTKKNSSLLSQTWKIVIYKLACAELPSCVLCRHFVYLCTAGRLQA
jgi:hypothetical protein